MHAAPPKTQKNCQKTYGASVGHAQTNTHQNSHGLAGQRIGLLGGSFNPPHYGHLKMAKHAKKSLNLDAVWFLVSPQNPLKSTAEMAPFNDRLHMCTLLSKATPWLHSSAYEQEHGLTFSSDTVKKLKKDMPNTRFYWLIGADNFKTLHLWHNWRELMQTLPIAVFRRGGEKIPATPAKTFMQKKAKGQQLPEVIFIENALNPISATYIRQNIDNKTICNKALPKTVIDYIALKGLYPKIGKK